jgi:hypothetical protein
MQGRPVDGRPCVLKVNITCVLMLQYDCDNG